LAGRLELADQLLAHAQSGEPPDTLGRARLDEALGIRALFDGDPSVYLSRSAAAIRAFEEAGDLRSVCIPRVNFGGVCIEIGAYAEAEKALRAALEAAERMGLSTVVTAARANLALSLARQGSIREALSIAHQALQAAEVQDDRRVEAGARSYLASILFMSGELDASEREAQAAVDLLTGSPPLRARALATLSQIELALGKSSPCLAAAEEGMRVLDQMGGIEEGESLVRLAYAEALAANGKSRDAERAIASARDRVLERAAKISDMQWRASFLERVVDNVRTLALARAWIATPLGSSERA
jgi:tetratricopeptide (TPR) repeat protein